MSYTDSSANAATQKNFTALPANIQDFIIQNGLQLKTREEFGRFIDFLDKND